MDPSAPLLPPTPQYSTPPQPPLPPQAQPVLAPQQQGVVVQESSIELQVADVLQKSKNVLVTVGVDPSVDELATALGLTVLLGQLGKHATAVFSGKVPPAIEFLDPEKTFEDTVDSLRDFIIALDKEKADKLRYKVEDDVVKIFITPYRTVITEKDFSFSQGDFNVDAVVALGVEKREELDKAITAHGRILHDATFVTVNVGNQVSSIGTINWNDAEASSIAEMLVHLSAQISGAELDSQISTAFLTGIVAETNRFSNEKTTPKVMTLAAQLMAAGANQQLIASNLRQEGMISESVRLQQDTTSSDDGEMVLHHKSEKDTAKETPTKKEAKKEPASKKTPPEKDEQSAEEAPVVSPVATKGRKIVVPPAPTVDADSPEPEAKTTEEVPQASTPAPVAAEDDNAPVPVVAPPQVTPPTLPPKPASHEQTEKPVFGGKLNSFTDNPDTKDTKDVPAEAPQDSNFTLTHNGDSIADDTANEEALEAARKAVEEAAVDSPTKRLESVGASPLSEVASQSAPAVAPELPQAAPVVTPAPFAQPEAAVAMQSAPLPPPPPLPAPAVDGSLPPLPPLPPQPATTEQAMAPQTAPSFLQDLQATQNTWTQAGQDLATTQAAAASERQDKIDDRLRDYDQAVDRTRELGGLPPLNNPNGSGLPPVPPTIL